MRVAQPTRNGLRAPLPAIAQKQDEAHDVFVLLRPVGINRNRRHLSVVVKDRIAGGGPALALGPAAAQARLDFLEGRGKGPLGLTDGRERKGVAGIRSPSVERTVSPARQRKLGFEEIALPRLPDDSGKPLFGVYKRGDVGECRTVCRPVLSVRSWYLRHQYGADSR